MTAIPFSQALRERTWNSHGSSEGAGFMTDLMRGNATRDDYVALVVQHYFIYEAIEAVAAELADDAIASAFITDRLTRMPALEADLEFLVGSDWRQTITPLPATLRYVARVKETASWSSGFVAHHYTRYLGDLSGGQHIYKVMQRHFGLDKAGILFYLFEEIESPAEFKDAYREQLDAVAWTAEERERVINEVLAAYQFNTDLFTDLSADKAAKTAA